MSKLVLSKEERSIIDIFGPGKSEYQLPETLPVDFIIDNRLCYSLYNKVGAELESKYDSEDLDRIRRKAKSMEFSVNEVSNIAKAFEENGINFVVQFKALLTQCDSKDVDIVIENRQFAKAKELLENLGYYAPILVYEDHYVKSKGSGETLIIDPDTEERYNTFDLCFFDEKKMSIFDTKRKINGLYMPSPEVYVPEYVVKIIYKRRIPLGTVLFMAYILENCHDINYLEKCVRKAWFTPLLHWVYVINIIYKNLYGKDIDAPLVAIAEKKHSESRTLGFLAKITTKKIKLPFYSRFLLFYWGTYKLFHIWHLYKFQKVIAHTMKCALPTRVPIRDYIKLVLCARKKNMFVSFSGIDGTGKTTQITKLVNRFKGMMIPAQYGRGLWSPKISYPLMGVLYLVKGWRRKDYHKSRFLKKTWNYIVILDFLCIYFFRIKVHLLIGKTVFCDRYVYDLIATLMHDGLYNERASKLLLKLSPQPDLAFMLDIPAEVSDLRKEDTQGWLDEREVGESAPEYLKIMRKNFMAISKLLNIPIIDATKGIDEIHEELFNKTLETYKNKGVNTENKR
ncbi:MAG: hypothetical protein KAW47_11000 [Thermoplasmatales archaeon]|nr:hypothetical protein [Thermoplasmatales archaeon]